MSGNGRGEQGDSGKTVFRPSPLQGLKQGQAQPFAPPPALLGGTDPGAGPDIGPNTGPGLGYAAPPPLSRAGQGPATTPRLGNDDVPQPATPARVRNVMLAAAEPVLALIAGVRSGRVRLALPDLHRQTTAAIAQFERDIANGYPEEKRQRAKYAVCATTDDVAQNLPGLGTDGAEWARRSMVVQVFHENIGGDRFWQLVDDMLRTPGENLDLIELYHACLAAGFEGRFRVMPDGRRRLHEIMARLHGALPHVRSVSSVELSPHWRGEDAPVAPVGWSLIALAAAVAGAVLLLLFVILRLMLMSGADDPRGRLGALRPDQRLTLSRPAAALPPQRSAQASRLAGFLEPEIKAHLVSVEEDAQTVRVRTTVGQLFRSGSDQLEPGRDALFHRIGRAIEQEQGAVTIEGHADSDKAASLTFPDNMALSEARAKTVGGLISADLTTPGRISTKGMGDTVPIADNATPEGKSQNRRVEVIVPRSYMDR